MNESFFQLPEEKQKRILDAGYAVFSRSTYAKANMQDIADKASISKSLLFHYFHNKRELYLYLWNEAARITYESLGQADAFARDSLFEMMETGMTVKFDLMDQMPDMARFALQAFLEDDPKVRDAIQASYNSWFAKQAARAIQEADQTKVRQDQELVLEQIRLASEGYLWRMGQKSIDLEQLKQDTRRMMAFWKEIYGTSIED